MKTLKSGLFTALATVCAVSSGPWASGQIAVVHNRLGTTRSTEFRISEVEVNADVRQQVATVQIAQTFQNVGRRTLETQFLFPLPHGAAINGLTLIVDGKELPGELQPKEQARKTYEDIVRRQQDPALLEYMERGLFKTSVFPIPAGQKRRVEIRYTQLLKSDSGLVDFTLPLGTTKHSDKAVEKVDITVRVRSEKELKNVYSPTHDFDIERPDDNRANCSLVLSNIREPDDVRLLYSTRGDDIGVNLVTFRSSDDEQGYFLLLATPRVKAKKEKVIPKTVLFVVDRSGSMSGEKIKQAKASLAYMIKSLGPQDTFNIISYSSEVELFRPELEEVTDKTRKDALTFAEDIYSGGGTNINEALTTALEQLKDKDRPGYVLFFTDGLPTVGVTREKDIAQNADKANEVNARVFSFGVGYDVNSRLLDRLSRDQRGTSVYVKPEEDIEVASTSLFQKVSSPVMNDVKLLFVNEKQSGSLVNRVYPKELPDLFRGEQLVVVGRYKKNVPVTVDMTGMVSGKARTLTLNAEFGSASDTRRNGFVETLWATRRIGQIIDDLDLNGHNRELVDELVALSLKHGIMTPYTSFLADENVSFEDRRRLMTEAGQRTFDGLAVTGGAGGFLQRDFKKALQNAQRGGSGTAPSAAQMRELESASIGFGGGGRGDVRGKSSSRATSAIPGRPAADLAADADADEGDGKNAEAAEEAGPKVRKLGGKTFYWKSNEWQDADLAGDSKDEKSDEKDIIEVEQFTAKYFELARLENGRYGKLLVLSEPVVVKIGDRVYRIVLPKKKKG